MNPSVPLSPHAQPSHGIELFSLYVYLAGVCSLPHSPQERRGVRKVENSRVAFRRSLRFGASQLCGSTWLVSSCGVQVDKRSRVEGCDPGSSLGHAHPHGGATTSSASANGCCGKTFPRARRRHCCPPCMCWPCACCALRLIQFLHMMLSVCVCTTPQSMSLPRSPGRRRGGSKVQNSRVAFKRSFRFGGETSIVQGNFAFSGCQMSKIFSGSASGRRGHAPHGRRGQVFCSTNVIQTLLRI